MINIFRQLEEYKTVGEYIRASRKYVDKSQRQLAIEGRTSRQTIVDIEKNKTNSSFDLILRLLFILKAAGAADIKLYQLKNISPKKS